MQLPIKYLKSLYNVLDIVAFYFHIHSLGILILISQKLNRRFIKETVNRERIKVENIIIMYKLKHNSHNLSEFELRDIYLRTLKQIINSYITI